MKTSRNVALTHERLKQLLHYDPETGVFTWRVQLARRTRVGSTAGSRTKKGYNQIGIDGKYYRSNRLAWFYTHGVWPVELVDHENGERDQDKLSNLREATHSQNSQNRKALGVSWHRRRNKYQSRIYVKGKPISLGYFKDLEEAISARKQAERGYFGDFCRAN